MCKFCEKIIELKVAEEISHWDYDNLLVIDEGYFAILTSCEDDYYTGVSMYIDYCPKCGRKLKK